MTKAMVTVCRLAGHPNPNQESNISNNIGYVVETICHQTGRMQEVTSCQFCCRQEEVG
jgi:hypothetical protein